MKKLSLFIYNTIITGSTSFFLNFITIIFNIYISNILSNDTIGIYQLILSIHYFMVTLSTFGINLTITKVISEELALNNIKITNASLNITRDNLILINHPYIQSKLKKILKTSFTINLLLSFITMGFFIYFSPFFTKFYLHNKISNIPLYICSISLPFISISNTLIGYFSGIRKAFNISISRLIEELSQFSIILFSIHFLNLNNNSTYIFLTSALTISEIIACTTLLFLFYKDLKNEYSFSISKLKYIPKSNKNVNYNKKIFKILIPIGTTSIFRSTLSTLKQLLIPISLKKFGMNIENALSNYGIITGIIFPLILFPNIIISSISSLLIPEIAQYYIKKDYYTINNIIYKVFNKSFKFSIILAIFFYYFSNKLSIILYPNKSPNEITQYIKILSPLIIFMYSDNIIDSFLNGINKQLIVMLTNILDLILSILLINILIPRLGLSGYIIILFISEFFNFSVSLLELKNNTKFKLQLKKHFLIPLFIAINSITIISIFSKYIFNIYYNYNLFIFFIEAFIYLLLIFIQNKYVFKNHSKI